MEELLAELERFPATEKLPLCHDSLVEYIASVLEIPNYPFGSTRWRRQNDPDGTGAEPMPVTTWVTTL